MSKEAAFVLARFLLSFGSSLIYILLSGIHPEAPNRKKMNVSKLRNFILIRMEIKFCLLFTIEDKLLTSILSASKEISKREN
jgi:hypothetical protein